MHQPTYREALQNAWKLVWHNTSLWLLGLLSVLFAGSFGLGNFLAHLIVNMNGTTGLQFIYLNLASLQSLKPATMVGLAWLIVLMIIVAVAIIFISVVAKTSLLVAVADFYKSKAAPKLEKIWNAGLKFFWKILCVEILRKVLLGLVASVFGIIWFFAPTDKNVWCLLLAVLALIAAIILGWIISAVSIFTAGYTVIDGKPLGASIKRAWKLFTRHLLVSFEVSVILTIIDLLVVVGFVVIFYFSFLPTIFVWLIAGALSNAALALFGAMLGFVLLIIFITIFGAIYNTFYTSVWMYLFMKMHHEGIFSRLLHHLGKWFK